MRIVKRYLLLSVILGGVLILMVGSAFAEAKLFSCDTEDCTYNGNTSRWDCHYVGCPVMPAWINQTNTTIINTTQVNISSCNMTEMQEYWDGYVGRIDKRFNFSVDLEDCQDSVRSCRNQLETASNLLVGMVNQSLLSQCQQDASAARTQAQAADSGGWYKLLGGLALGAGGAWFFWKKPEAERSKLLGTPGDITYNPKAITQDGMISRLQAKIEELEGKLGRGKPPVAPRPPAGRSLRKGATPNPYGDDEEGR